jgi:Vitamin K-dependent gamma-carboxylase
VNPVRLWQAFWFPAVPVRRLAAFRVVMTSYALVDIWLVSGFASRYSRVDDLFYRPVVLLRPLPRLGPEPTTIVHVVLAVALAFALVGLFTRAALWIAAPLYLWWWATFYSFGAVHHGRITVVAALFVLAIAPAGDAYSLDSLRARHRAVTRDELAGWALRVMMVVVVAAYLLAAYAKLTRSGVGWVTGDALAGAMVRKGTPAGLLLVSHEWAIHTMATLTLLLEATAWVMFLRGRIRDAYVACAVLFHAGTLVVLNINFLGLILAYLAFYDLEIGVDRLRAWLGRRLTAQAQPREVQLP